MSAPGPHPADGVRSTPAALLALGLGTRGEGDGDGQGAGEDAELEAFLCALPDLELHGCLGRGGMGRVYRARQIRLDRFVAVKVMNAELGKEPEFRERFEREARALARLDHPGIVRVHDFGEAGGTFYLTMEFVEGPNLRDVMAAGIDADEASHIVAQLCDALAYAHARGVVHRDIKPENVLLDRQGRVRVADFGLAKLQQVEPHATTRRVVGTPQYMAPEQLTDPSSVDHRADVFAIGVVFYEMLTGQLPVGRFPAPSELGRGDTGLDEVVLRALESNRDKRFQAASEIRDALQSRAIDDPRTATRPTVATTRRGGPRRWVWPAAAAGLLAASIPAVWLATAPEPEAAVPAAPAPEADERGGHAASPAEADAPVLLPTRWPGRALALLHPDTAMLVGVDWAELRQAPALQNLGIEEGTPYWAECAEQVINRSHKVIVAFDDEAKPRDFLVHGDWAPPDIEACVRAVLLRDPKLAADRVAVRSEPFGDHLAVRFKAGEGDEHALFIAVDGARMLVTMRQDVTPDDLDGRLAAEQGDSELARLLAERVDLTAPLWAMATTIPGDWHPDVVSAWGQAELWDSFAVDATVRFTTDEAATRAADLLRSYATILSRTEEGKLGIDVGQTGSDVAIKGTIPFPENSIGSAMTLSPGDGDKGPVHFSFGISK